MKHFVVTNRDIIERDGTLRIDDSRTATASEVLRFAEYRLGGGVDGVTVWEDAPEGHIDYAADATASYGSGRFFRELYSRMLNGGRDTLFFIHGFSNSLSDSLTFLDRLHKQYVENDGPIGQIVLFAWPTNGVKWEYRKDAADAVPSGQALARLLRKLIQFLGEYIDENTHPPCYQQIHLLAQSMGNQVLEAMMADLTQDFVTPPMLLSEIILTGADVGENALQPGMPLSHLPKMGERIHVYVHQRDRALLISQRTKNGLRRLGRVGPKSYDRDEFIVVDVTDTDDETTVREKLVNHWYFCDVEEVRRDVRAILSGTLTREIGTRSRRTKHPEKEGWFYLPR